jgi:hypothetical protein
MSFPFLDSQTQVLQNANSFAQWAPLAPSPLKAVYTMADSPVYENGALSTSSLEQFDPMALLDWSQFDQPPKPFSNEGFLPEHQLPGEQHLSQQLTVSPAELLAIRPTAEEVDSVAGHGGSEGVELSKDGLLDALQLPPAPSLTPRANLGTTQERYEHSGYIGIL